MASPTTPLVNFVQYVRQHIPGDEKGEAQIFCDRPFQASERGNEIERDDFRVSQKPMVASGSSGQNVARMRYDILLAPKAVEDLGDAAGRYLFCVVIHFPDGSGYPVTAREMTAKEKRSCRRWRDR